MYNNFYLVITCIVCFESVPKINTVTKSSIFYENLKPLLGSQVPVFIEAGLGWFPPCRPGCVLPGAGKGPPNRIPISGDQIPPAFVTGGGTAFALVGSGAVNGCCGVD